MDKTYTIRKGRRADLRCSFIYHGDGFMGEGTLRNVSRWGWRAIGNHPVTKGDRKTVYLELPDGGESRYLLIETAVVRWTNGNEAGWEINKIDSDARARLDQFLGCEMEEDWADQSVENHPRRNAA
jgi:hypothetical protein